MQSQQRLIGQLLFVVALAVGVAAASLEPVWGHLSSAISEMRAAGERQEVRVVKVAAKAADDVASLTPKLLAAAYGSGLARSYGLHVELVAVCGKDAPKSNEGCAWEARATLRNAGDGSALGVAKTELAAPTSPLGKERKEWSAATFDVAPLHRIRFPKDTSEDDVIARLHQAASELAAAVAQRSDVPAEAKKAARALATFAAPRNALLQQLAPALERMRAAPTLVLGSIVNGKGEERFLSLQLLSVQSGDVVSEARANIGSPFPPTLPLFFGAALLCLLGIVLWRPGIAQEIAALASGASQSEGASQDDPFALLEALVPAANAIRAKLDSLDEPAIMAEVDTLLTDYVLPFAEVRTGVTDRLGMALGAEILVTVAYGERMLNRTWSAASDDHLPEARSSFPEAADALEHALDLAKSAQQR